MKYSMALLLISSSLMASIGEITALRGTADLQRGTEHIPVTVGTKLEKHDRIDTAPQSKLQIVFNDKTVISLGQKSRFSVDEYLFDDKNVQARFTIKKGFFKSITGKIGKIAPSHFKVRTANATIGVRGTTIIGEISQKRDIIACTYGRIVVSTPQGSVVVNQGERTVVAQAKAPREAERVNRIIMKQLDKKSDPAVAPSPIAPVTSTAPVTTLKTETTESKRVVEEQKESQKTTQIIEETPQQQEQLSPREEIANVLGTQRPVYEGRVTEGSTSYGVIQQDDYNRVHLGFDLGDGSMQGNIQFHDNVEQYNIDVGGKLKEDATFDFNSRNGYDGGGHGKLEGTKYEQANGTFHFEEKEFFNLHTNKIDGKFEADLKR
ncbi:MAG: hypothetical protein DSZ05_05535 [Sulfurospirillum sp.]|nr:MAG: hypothetical protein DSZ05_05535 [Sulfurospirillum sp.]